MAELTRYCQAWQLQDPHQLCATKTSTIYRVQYDGHDAILKLLTETGKVAERDSAKALRCFSGDGAVRLYRSDESALLLEYLPGPSLRDYLLKHDHLAAAEILCDVVLKLASASSRSQPSATAYQGLDERFVSLFARAKTDDCPEIFRVCAKTSKSLLHSPRPSTLCHGDIHHLNILRSADRGWLAIDPQPVLAELSYDLANSFYNPLGIHEDISRKERILALASLYGERSGVAARRILQFAFAFGGLSASWQLDAGEDAGHRLDITHRIKGVLEAYSG